MPQSLIVPPGTKIKLKDYDAEYSGEYKRKSEIKEQMDEIQERMRELQGLLYAESKHALLIILQAMDAGGKDGTIRNVISGVNPQGCDVVSFKVPSAEEIAHDFLWRIHKAVPPKGKIVIFNRSHYEFTNDEASYGGCARCSRPQPCAERSVACTVRPNQQF